jgi:hypothetical protein
VKKLLHTIGALTLATTLFGSPLALADNAGVTEPAPAATGMEKLPPKDAAADAKAQAEAKITKEQAIELAQKLVTIPQGYTVQNVSLIGNSYEQMGPSWNIGYLKKEGNQYLGNINVSLSAVTGKLISYNISNTDPSYKPSYPPKANYQGAKDIAAKWLEQINPQALQESKYNDKNEKSFRPPLKGNVTYEIRYERSVNGVTYPQNYVSVVVNGDGEVTGYNTAWTDGVTFDDTKGIITPEAANAAIRERMKPSLSYIIPYQARTKKPLIVYGMGLYPIDARTGDIYKWDGVQLDDKPNTTPLSEKPLGSAPAANLSLTKEEAIAKVTSTFTLPQGMKLEDATFSENTDDLSGKTVSTWNLRWAEQSDDANAKIGKPVGGVYATVDSKTGEIRNYNSYKPYDSSAQVDVKVKQDEAKTKAIDFVKKMLPAYTNELVLQNMADTPISIDVVKRDQGYSFTFARYIDGVRAGYDSVNVTIDAETGDVRNYSANFSTIDFPEKQPQTIGVQQAQDQLLSVYDLQLQYVSDSGVPPYIPLGTPGMGGYADSYMVNWKTKVAAGEIDPSKPAKAAHLVYTLVPKYPLREAYVLDAASGGWISPDSGDPVVLENVKVTDIDGHWAQQELQLMLDYQALDVKDGLVSPDASITKGELIKMLVISMNGGAYGIKYDAARSNSFADVKNGSAYFPYVERAVDLRILDRTGGNFDPDAKMTREEMAELIVRALGYGKLAEHGEIFAKPFADEAALKRPGDVAIVAGLGIMTAADDGKFNPAQPVTKAQAATAFSRYLLARSDLQNGGSPFGPMY